MTDTKRSSWPSTNMIVTVIVVLLCLGEFIRVELILKEHVTRIRDLESTVRTNRQQHDERTTSQDQNVNPTKPVSPRLRVRRDASDSLLTDLQKLQQLHKSVCNITITDMKCRAGPPGPPGRPGQGGRRGMRGPKGEMGIPGKHGYHGNTGPPGPRGIKGERGIMGNPGLDGNAGSKGARGSMGLKGERGEKGDPGTSGQDGVPGIDGPPGLMGMKGEKGIMGNPGLDGNAGSKGARGSMGLKGERGEKGEQGPKGTSGSTGNPGLTVSPWPPQVIVSPPAMVIKKNKTATFNCFVRGYPEPVIGWRKVEEGNSSLLTSNSALVISNVRPSDAGTYRCQAKNIFGTEEKTVYLAVNYFRDCSEIYLSGERQNGVYTVDPDGRGAFQVYCDMIKDGGGWTVFQRRQDGSVDFYRDWNQYKTGFGNLNGEFWLGNDKIHRLTSRTASKLRVDLEDWDGTKEYAKYGRFSVGSEGSMYRLSVRLFSGTAGDSLDAHDGMPFSTADNDNDSVWISNCAREYFGAWWYSNCHTSNLNGEYLGNAIREGKGVVWYSFKNNKQSLKFTEMKLKPT